MPETPDPVADRLKRAPLPNAVRAQLWDLYHGAADEDDLATKLQTIKVPRPIAADLWDLKAGKSAPVASAPAPEKSWSQQVGADLLSRNDLGSQRKALDDMSAGMRASVARTVYGGGDIIRRMVGMDRIANEPDVQAAMTPPDSSAGSVGFYGDQGAQFAIPLTRLSGLTQGLRLPARMAVDAAASAGVAGVQSGGDTGQMEGAAALGAFLPPAFRGAAKLGKATIGAAQRAAAGAQEGGIGGAVAGALRSAAPSDPHTMVFQALKPKSTNIKFTGSLKRALPEIKVAEAEIGKPIEGLEDLMTATDAAKKRVRAQFDAALGPGRQMGATLDLSKVADEMESSIPSKVKLEDPRAAEAIRAKADIYRSRRFSLDEAEQLLKETNAELDAYYGKYPAAQRTSRTANPEVAHTVAQAGALRTAIYDTPWIPGQPTGAVRELQRRYGALMDVEQEATRRLNVSKRQQPESLAEQVAGAGAMGDLARGAWKLAHFNISGAADIASARAQRAGARFLKEQQTTDALIRRAFASFKGRPIPVEMPPAAPVRGLLGRGPIVTPPPTDPSGGGTVRAAVMDADAAGGPVYSSDPNHGQYVRRVEGEVVEDAAPVQRPQGQLPAGDPRALPPAPTQGALPPARGQGELPPAPTQRALPPAPEPAPAVAPAKPSKLGRAFDAAKQKATAKRGAPRTSDVARAAGTDAANRSAKAAGREAWNEDDYNAAAKAYDTVSPPPAETTVQPAGKAEPQTPAAAAAEVTNEIDRVIDLKGAKSATDVHMRVIKALEAELPGAQQAASHGTIEVRPGKAYGGREGVVIVDGEYVASFDRYGKMSWAGEGGSYQNPKDAPVSTKPKIGFNGHNMTPTEIHRQAKAEVTRALGEQNKSGAIRVQIPGDGTFTIQRSPEAIREVISRIVKGGPKPWQGLVDQMKRPTGYPPKPKATW